MLRERGQMYLGIHTGPQDHEMYLGRISEVEALRWMDVIHVK